ncbi:MAG: hypothetical protein KIT73_17665 [Burkholderiales bacterium]|nr:hypothetical protein [Burkholderiales bacterium]
MHLLLPRILALLSVVLVLFAGVARADISDAKVQALMQAHDWLLCVVFGERMAKQQVLVAARDVLDRRGREQGLGPEWKRGNPDYDAAEAAMAVPLLAQVQNDWSSLNWAPAPWARVIRSSLTEAEVDALLAHFSTEIGRKQAMIIQHAVAFHQAGVYTMSGKFIAYYPGTDAEQKRLTEVYADEDRAMRFSVASNDNSEGQRFALSELGRKYQTTLVIKWTGEINARLDRVLAALPVAAAGLQGEADPFIRRFLAAAPAKG